jgi:predicted Holliday junction resolvase-like endonuclease
MGESFLLRSFGESLLETPGVTEGVEKLATSGPMGLAIVVLAFAVVYLALEIRKIQNTRLEDAKENTTEMLKLSDKTNQVVNQATQELASVKEKLEEVEATLREANEVIRTLREPRIRR